MDMPDHKGPWASDLEKKTFYWVPGEWPFVAYRRSGIDPRYQSAALAVVRPIMRLTIHGNVWDIIGTDLSDEFKPDGASHKVLTYTALNTWANELSWPDTPCPLTRVQAYRLAQLGAALLNFDTRNLNQETKEVIRIHPDDRAMVEEMINLVILGLGDRESIAEILPIDLAQLRAEQARQDEALRRALQPKPWKVP